MKLKQNHTEHLHYIDDEGHRFEMEVIKRFTYEEKKYVLLSERDGKHKHGKNCTCHDKSHHHKNEKELYVFESIRDNDTEKLIPVSEETREKIERLL